MSRTLEIANEINRQIKALDPLSFCYIGTRDKGSVEIEGKPGLRLICTKGIHVDILLNEGEDLYEVYAWKWGRGVNRMNAEGLTHLQGS